MSWQLGMGIAFGLLIVIWLVAEIIHRFGPGEDDWSDYRRDQLRRKIERDAAKTRWGGK